MGESQVERAARPCLYSMFNGGQLGVGPRPCSLVHFHSQSQAHFMDAPRDTLILVPEHQQERAKILLLRGGIIRTYRKMLSQKGRQDGGGK